MNRMMSRGLVWGCLLSAVPYSVWAQDDPGATVDEKSRTIAAQVQAVEAAQLKAAVDELQAKLQQARDEVQQALAQRDEQEQIAELQQQLQAARDEAERLKLAEADRAKQALDAQEIQGVSWRLARELIGRLNQDPRADDVALDDVPVNDVAVQVKELQRLQADLAAKAAQVEAGGLNQRGELNQYGEQAHRQELIDAASQALFRAHEEQSFVGMLQQLRQLGRFDEAAQLEAKAREMGIQLPAAGEQTGKSGADQWKRIRRARQDWEGVGQASADDIKQRTRLSTRAAGQEAGGPDAIRQVIEELRGEVRQLREEVHALRKALEARPAANQGSLDTLRPEELFRIHSRIAGEVVQLGQVDAGDGASRPVRAGDQVRKGDVLAVVRCEQIGETQSELIDALARWELDRKVLQQLERAGREVVPESTFDKATRTVEVDQITVRRLERTLRSWHIDERDLEAIREQAQRDVSGDREAVQLEAVPWGQVKVLAPVDGVVLERNVNEGELVELDANLFILRSAQPEGR